MRPKLAAATVAPYFVIVALIHAVAVATRFDLVAAKVPAAVSARADAGAVPVARAVGLLRGPDRLRQDAGRLSAVDADQVQAGEAGLHVRLHLSGGRHAADPALLDRPDRSDAAAVVPAGAARDVVRDVHRRHVLPVLSGRDVPAHPRASLRDDPAARAARRGRRPARARDRWRARPRGAGARDLDQARRVHRPRARR